MYILSENIPILIFASKQNDHRLENILAVVTKAKDFLHAGSLASGQNIQLFLHQQMFHNNLESISLKIAHSWKTAFVLCSLKRVKVLLILTFLNFQLLMWLFLSLSLLMLLFRYWNHFSEYQVPHIMSGTMFDKLFLSLHNFCWNWIYKKNKM